MFLFFSISIIISISFIFCKLARRFNISEVIGLLVASCILTLPSIQEYTTFNNNEFIYNLSYLGLLALMFLSGLEISGNILFKEKKDSFIITISTFFTSLIIGILFFKLLNYKIETAIVMGFVLE